MKPPPPLAAANVVGCSSRVTGLSRGAGGPGRDGAAVPGAGAGAAVIGLRSWEAGHREEQGVLVIDCLGRSALGGFLTL